MRRSSYAIVLTIIAALATLSPARAEGPRYWILGAPSVWRPHVHGHHPGTGELRTATTYAYGWFGAQARLRVNVRSNYYGTTKEVRIGR